MQYREDKRTGNKISILGFGCMRLPSAHGQINIDKTEELFLKAIDKGINYFDTAYLYPGSEAAIGKIFSKHNLRKDVYIATKLPLMMCRKASDFERIFQTELERLQTDYIDYYFMHMLTSPKQWEQLCALGIREWIAEKREKGQIRQVGFSFHGKKEDFIELADIYDWDFCQIQYNYINTHYQAGTEGLKYASAKGLPVFIMEPMLGGRLANGLPKKALKVMKDSDKNMTPVGWALKWLWNQQEVTMLLSGMNEMEQLDENVRLAEDSVPEMFSDKENETIEQVIKVFNDSYKIPCTGCSYCMPCPQGINIPGCFAAYNSSYSISKSVGMNQYMLSTGAMSQTPVLASACIKCGKCESHCPQSIPIREALVDVRKRLQPFWMKPAIAVVRKVMR